MKAKQSIRGLHRNIYIISQIVVCLFVVTISTSDFRYISSLKIFVILNRFSGKQIQVCLRSESQQNALCSSLRPNKLIDCIFCVHIVIFKHWNCSMVTSMFKSLTSSSLTLQAKCYVFFLCVFVTVIKCWSEEKSKSEGRSVLHWFLRAWYK